MSSSRYGFNGKERDTDNEWGNSTAYDYGFRIYDPAIAKFLSVDPLAKKFPMLTPYQFASNSPIWMVDLDGLEGTTYNQFQRLTKSEKKLLVTHFWIKNQLEKNRALAFQKTAEEFTGTESEKTGFHNDEADAFRHAFFNALNAQSFGKSLANDLGRAHEALDDPEDLLDKENEIKMDLHNNAVGQDIGSANSNASADKIVNLIEKERKAGSLVVLKNPSNNKSSLIPSNDQNTVVDLRDNGGTPVTLESTVSPNADNTRVSTNRAFIIPEQVKKQ